MKPRTKYQCGKCKDIHEDEDSALVCCAPTVIEIYECPECGADHTKINRAVECCSDPENETLTPEQLEAIGQQRLF